MDVLRPLPRQPPPPRTVSPAPRVGAGSTLRAAPWVVALRSVRWTVASIRFGVRVVIDQVRGRTEDVWLGRRLRALFEEVGGTAPKLGQQMAMRIDMLPFDACTELAKLSDHVPPFPTDLALSLIEAELGGPIATWFEAFDPEPIGSASIAAVWQGRLHGGRKVAVKVKRPGVDAAFAADLDAFGWLTQLLELTTLVRPGFFENVRIELRDMLLEELDLRQEARYQRIFRDAAERAELGWVSAPAIVSDLSTGEIMVSDFVEGSSAVEVLAAAESRDPAALAALAARDIDPQLLARRVVMLAFWGQHESPIFHADPHPGNIIIQPGSKLVLVDFGACGATNENLARLGRRIAENLRRHQPSDAADVALVQSAPFPPLAFHAFRQMAQTTFRKWHHGGQDPKAEWWERSTATVWLSFVEGARKFQVPANLNTLRIVRCTLLYDTIATRLDPGISISTFAEYLTEAKQRMADSGATRLRQGAVEQEQGWATATRALLRQAASLGDRAEALGEVAQQVRASRRSVSWELQRAVLASVPLAAIVCAIGWVVTTAVGLGPSREGWWAHPATWFGLFLAWWLGSRRLGRRLHG